MARSYAHGVQNFSSLEAFRQLQREMNRWFESDVASEESGYPSMNIWYDEEKAIAAAELPGVDPSKIDVTVVANMLTVSGERLLPELKAGAVIHRRERPYGKFMRSIELPFSIDGNAVSAEYQNGMLTLTLPRIAEQKPRKIQIQ